MGSRARAHQLRNGLYVSGAREDQQGKEKQASNSCGTPRAVPYTGGDIKKSGELGKMFDIDHLPRLPSRPSSSSQPNSGSNSGSLKKSSGPIPLHPTGLITSGPLTSSGPLPPSRRETKAVYGSAVTNLTEEVKVGVRVSRGVVWLVVVLVAMGLMVGAFLMVAVRKGIIMVGLGAVLVPLILGIVWNCFWGKRGFMGYVRSYPDVNLRGAIDGQYVKLTGVITCGSIPLETSYQRIPRCVYVSTELYEYRGLGGKTAHPKHRFFSWGSRHSEKYVADFYISDFQSGLRALVKAGYGAKVASFVKPATVVDIVKGNRDLSPNFQRWLADRNLSSDDRIMRLKEGYIKEGSTVSVMGVVRRHDNVLMIVPSQEPISTGCQLFRCLLPTYVEGLVLTCEDNENVDVVPV